MTRSIFSRNSDGLEISLRCDRGKHDEATDLALAQHNRKCFLETAAKAQALKPAWDRIVHR